MQQLIAFYAIATRVVCSARSTVGDGINVGNFVASTGGEPPMDVALDGSHDKCDLTPEEQIAFIRITAGSPPKK